MSRAARAALLPLLSLSACAGTFTIRELGHPELEQVVGADTRFVRAGDEQVGGLDAYPATSDGEGDHRLLWSIIPLGVEGAVALDVRAARRPPTGLPLASLTVAAYALTEEQSRRYARDGALPEPERPLALLTTKDAGEQGVLILTVQVPRDALPAGTVKLAFPICAQFADGWLHLIHYQTDVPAAAPASAPVIDGETPPGNPAPTEHPGGD